MGRRGHVEDRPWFQCQLHHLQKVILKSLVPGPASLPSSEDLLGKILSLLPRPTGLERGSVAQLVCLQPSRGLLHTLKVGLEVLRPELLAGLV